MKIRTSIAAAGAAVVLGGTGAFLIPVAASAHAVTHTLKFTSVQVKSAMFTKTTSALADNDVNSAGKLIGFDLQHFTVHPTTKTVSVAVTVDTSGGLLYGTVTGTFSSPVAHGTVTGGTGRFKRATGTVVARNLNKSGTRTAVTITYTT